MFFKKNKFSLTFLTLIPWQLYININTLLPEKYTIWCETYQFVYNQPVLISDANLNKSWSMLANNVHYMFASHKSTPLARLVDLGNPAVSFFTVRMNLRSPLWRWGLRRNTHQTMMEEDPPNPMRPPLWPTLSEFLKTHTHGPKHKSLVFSSGY